jgi:hypothetical protein
MNIWCNRKARSCNHCCNRKSISVTYSECMWVNAHGSYCRLWPARFCYIFPHYLMNDTNFKKFIERKTCGLSFSTSFAYKISRQKENWATYDPIVYCSSCKLPVIHIIFSWNLNFFRQIIENYSNIKFHENPSSGSPGVPWGQMDRRTDEETWRS